MSLRLFRSTGESVVLEVPRTEQPLRVVVTNLKSLGSVQLEFDAPEKVSIVRSELLEKKLMTPGRGKRIYTQE